MRLLSFLAEVEKALVAESPAIDGGAWGSARMVNFHQGLARLNLSPRTGNDFPGGTVFIQAFAIADGSQCLKATLSWNGSEAARAIAVYTTPQINWKLEASRVATAWLEGAPAEVAAIPLSEPLQPLVAAIG
ncbi:MAG: hypothetical protein FJ399_18060 [Verrucomicrobia bacterium]|nr:hypothetical protein [Verrucomicrobiota bacterium]